MKVMVWGGTGFLGAWVCKAFQDAGDEVMAVDVNPPRKLTAGLLRGVQFAQCAIQEEQQVLEVTLDFKPDVVINLAYLAGSRSEEEPLLASKVNLMGPVNCMQAAVRAGVKRYLYSSSIGVYGSSQSLYGERAVTEKDGCTIEQHTISYGAMKAVNEFMARKFTNQYGLETCGVRISVLFGPWREHGFTTWASEAASAPVLGNTVKIPYSFTQRTSLVYVEDVAALFVRLAHTPHLVADIYNSGGYSLSMEEYTDAVKEGGPLAQFTFDEDAQEQPFVWNISSERVRADLGFQLTPLPQALARHIKAIRQKLTL